MINHRFVLSVLAALANTLPTSHVLPPLRHGGSYPLSPNRHTGVAAAKRLAKKRRQAKKP